MIEDFLAQNATGAYWLLFLDALTGGALFPVHRSFLHEVMQKLGDYSALWMVLVATAGGVIGSLANWATGRILRRWLVSRHGGSLMTKRMHHFTPIIVQHRWMILTGVIIPWAGGMVGVLTGLCGVGLRDYILANTLIFMGYYSISLLDLPFSLFH